MKLRTDWLLVVVFLFLLALPSESKRRLSVTHLLTEWLENPLGIDTPRPHFSWRLQHLQRGALQSAYQIQVASKPELLHDGKVDMWDSGKVHSSQSLHIRYEGKPLQSRTRYYWRVRVWDQNGVGSAYSAPAFFETALLEPSEWRAKWIAVPRGGGNGWHSQFADRVDVTKWVQLDLRQPVEFERVVLYPARPHNWVRDEPGFGFPVRFRLEASDTPDFTQPRLLADYTQADVPNPKTTPFVIEVGKQKARYVRLTVTKLHHPADTRPLVALAEMEVLDARGNNLALYAPVSTDGWNADSIEENDWSRAMLTDGVRESRPSDTYAPMLRREFRVEGRVRRARAYVTGLGYYELYLNGKKVGDHVLDPPYTNFHKRIYYSTYDVTPLLRRGNNCVGALLGNGWWRGKPHFLLQMHIEYTDGREQLVLSDDEWRWAKSPLLENSLYHGETYDARLEQPGWSEPGFSEQQGQWQPALVSEMPEVTLSAQMMPPIKVTQTIKPRWISEPRPGVFVVDFGQNFSGWCRLRVKGAAGTTVTLKHAEVLFENGLVNQQNLRSARATDTYILKGDGVEVYEPRFTYHGFRYVQVEGYPGTLTAEDIEGRVVHTAFAQRGQFECSNELLNQIQRNAQWGYRTNWHSIPTDCPQRDERQGWMGDAHMTANMGLYNFSAEAAYMKFLRDIADAQGEDGRIPDTVPHVWGTNPGDPQWAGAYLFIAWDMYRHTGAKHVLEAHYEGFKRYVEMLRREAGDSYILTRNNYGDWVAVVETPKDLVSTGTYYLTVKVLADIARVLGKRADEREYRELCAKIADAFQRRFWNAEAGFYGNGSQFSNIFPLYLGIVPEEHRQKVIDHVVHDITVNHKGHLSTGFIGTRYLLDTLTMYGRADIAYLVASQDTYPSWGYMVRMGATTIWELWKYEVGPGMNSHNHPAFGLVSGWFYEALAGIQPDASRGDWEHLIVRPHPVGDLRWAQASVDTIRGKVSVRWEKRPDAFLLSVTVPANSEATVYLPKIGIPNPAITEAEGRIWRNGQFVSRVPGVRSARDEGEWIVLQVGSGDYHFKLHADR
ncbi:MAG: family 78 glycoside hydrolase catalytic domain [Armatimonadota bacterium]|nr:family 78 glycoside hydrolase catalytic domain [Armatimonadota bacterium]